MTYILQRSIRSEVGKEAWFDDQRFDDKDRALATLRREKAFQEARIIQYGGSNWSGIRAQQMRVLAVVA